MQPTYFTYLPYNTIFIHVKRVDEDSPDRRCRPLRRPTDGADRHLGAARSSDPGLRHRPPRGDRGARAAPAPRLLQPVRLRQARARLQRRRHVSADRRHEAVRAGGRHARAAEGRLADAGCGGAVAVCLRPPRSAAKASGARCGSGDQCRSGSESRDICRAERLGSNGSGDGAAAGAGPLGTEGAGGRGGRQELTGSHADAGWGGPRPGDSGRSGAAAGRGALGAQGGHRRRVPARPGAAQGAAVARRPAHDAGATRGAAGQGGAGPTRPRPTAAARSTPCRQPDGRGGAHFGAEAGSARGPGHRFGGQVAHLEPRDPGGGAAGGVAARRRTLLIRRIPAPGGAARHGICCRSTTASRTPAAARSVPTSGSIVRPITANVTAPAAPPEQAAAPGAHRQRRRYRADPSPLRQRSTKPPRSPVTP